VIPVVYSYLSRRVFLEADHEPMHDETVPALPPPRAASGKLEAAE
jgi:hypothetical protein